MSPNRNHPPIHWRQGEGYIHPEDLPPPPPNAPPPFVLPGAFFPSPAGFWGPPPPPDWSSYANPPLFSPYDPFAAPLQPPSPPTKSDDNKDNKNNGNDKKNAPPSPPSEYNSPHPHIPGTIIHHNPNPPIHLHVLLTPSLTTLLTGPHNDFLSKQIHRFDENTTIEAVMAALKADRMTQVFEKGGGAFGRGTTWEMGGQGAGKGKRVLREFGWGGAGCGGVEPVWVVVRRKGGEE